MRDGTVASWHRRVASGRTRLLTSTSRASKIAHIREAASQLGPRWVSQSLGPSAPDLPPWTRSPRFPHPLALSQYKVPKNFTKYHHSSHCLLYHHKNGPSAGLVSECSARKRGEITLQQVRTTPALVLSTFLTLSQLYSQQRPPQPAPAGPLYQSPSRARRRPPRLVCTTPVHFFRLKINYNSHSNRFKGRRFAFPPIPSTP